MQNRVNDEYDFLPMLEDDNLFPNAEAFPTRDRHGDRNVTEEQEEGSERASSTTSSVAAPARRARRRKPIPLDHNLELRNADIARWSHEYVRNMRDTNQHKQQTRGTAGAKKNADFWVLGRGLGGFAAALGRESVPVPLQMFAGAGLLESLTGLRLTAAGAKHDREVGGDDVEDQDGRRSVRSRSDEDEVGRGADYLPAGDADDVPLYGDDVSGASIKDSQGSID